MDGGRWGRYDRQGNPRTPCETEHESYPKTRFIQDAFRRRGTAAVPLGGWRCRFGEAQLRVDQHRRPGLRGHWALWVQAERHADLDRMAAEGRRLTCFYAAPVCSPSRSSLMTGCYPKRVLPIPGVLFPAAAVGLNPSEQTIGELLKEAGYATACIGKWHLGDQPEFLPRQQGFDYYFGLPYSNDMGTAADGSKSSLGDPIPIPKPKAGKGANQVNDETGSRLWPASTRAGGERQSGGASPRSRAADARQTFIPKRRSSSSGRTGTGTSSSICPTRRFISRCIRARPFRASRPTAPTATGSRRLTGAWDRSSTACAS